MTLDVITSDALAPLQHVFFTRAGGASSGIFAGLNCGLGSSDQSEAVAINRGRAAAHLGLSATDLSRVHQVHSAEVISISHPPEPALKADALVTKTPGIALSILTADCQPVLFADAEAGVIGAAHAGWRGALDGILQRTVDAMVDLGAERARIIAVIGPSISQRAYEVGPEFLDQFTAHNSAFARFFSQGAGDRMQFDLPAFGLHCLNDASVAHAEWTRHCTYSDPDRFFSYRRSVHNKDPDYGRLLSAIRL